MTSLVTAEPSGHGRRPTVLYKFMLAPPVPPPETDLDDLIFDSDWDGWAVTTNVCFAPNPADPRRSMPAVVVSGDLVWSITDCHWPTAFPAAVMTKTLTGYTPGAEGWWNVEWIGTGHWFEYLQFHINQFTPGHGGGNLFPDVSGNKSGSFAVNDDGEIDMRFELQPGSSSISHNDSYVVLRLRLFLPTDPDDIPVIPSVDFHRTSFRRPITYQSNLYTPCEIEHTEPSYGVEDAPGNIQITMPGDDVIAMAFKQGITPAVPMVAIYEYHRPPTDEPDPADVRSVLYEIVSAEHGLDETVFNCVSILGQGDAVVPTGLAQRDYCSFATYDALTCGVNPDLHTFTGTVSAIDALTITVPGAGDFNTDPEYFVLGECRSGIYHTMVVGQSGDVMTLDEAIPGLEIGNTVSLLAGDNRTKETCLNKFNNSARRLSFPDMPVTNPYYGRGLAP